MDEFVVIQSFFVIMSYMTTTMYRVLNPIAICVHMKPQIVVLLEVGMLNYNDSELLNTILFSWYWLFDAPFPEVITTAIHNLQ